MSEFGTLLYQYRTKRRVSQSTLAERIDHSHSHISRLESGHRLPSQSMVREIANGLVLTQDEETSLMVAAGWDLIPEGDIEIRRIISALYNPSVPQEAKALTRITLHTLARLLEGSSPVFVGAD